MQTETILYITIAGIAALLIALFQYSYKSKLHRTLRFSLLSLRTLSVFGILVLLINPKFETTTFYSEKPSLVLAIDNSESISYLKQVENTNQIINTIKGNSKLNQRFNILSYSFDKTVKNLDSLNYNSKQTNISGVLKQFGEIYNNQTAPIILLTDGNQTYGSDYSYETNTVNQQIYPVILGDSAVYADLSIKQLNVNRFVFLKNKFPVEIIANYTGDQKVSTEFKIWSGNNLVFRKLLNFDNSKTSEIITTTLLADAVGVRRYRAELTPLNKEKNTVNNSKNFGVEVIDQKTNIALVSELIHPDLGAIKKAIESNEQRSATLLTPKEALSQMEDYQLVILYQPNNSFIDILSRLKEINQNTFTITGGSTNWNLLNNSQDFFRQRITNQKEDYQPVLNRNYSAFIVDGIDFSGYPPLRSEFGEFGIISPFEAILTKSVNDININEVLLATYEGDESKHAILNGEGIWKWRAQCFIETESFIAFDNFMNKLIQYISSNKKRQRLNLDYKSFYNGNDDISISAQYFNKNYEFDSNAVLQITIQNEKTSAVSEFPLLLDNMTYKIDLNGLDAGFYDFTVKNNAETISASGSFQILEYNVEQQFLNADIDRLKQVAQLTEGKYFFPNQSNELINTLLADKRYATIQKSTKKVVPLIDWKYLLGLISISLSLEWFIRKYNGLI